MMPRASALGTSNKTPKTNQTKKMVTEIDNDKVCIQMVTARRISTNTSKVRCGIQAYGDNKRTNILVGVCQEKNRDQSDNEEISQGSGNSSPYPLHG